MNSFTHTFKIHYLVLYVDYILGFLRRWRQDLSTLPLAFERSLLLTQPRLVCMFWLYNPYKEVGEAGQHSHGAFLIPCWKEIGHLDPIGVLNTVPLRCTRWTVHINEGPIFLLPTSASPRDSKGNLCRGRCKWARGVWHVKPEKVMKHGLGPLEGFLTKKCKSSSAQ